MPPVEIVLSRIKQILAFAILTLTLVVGIIGKYHFPFSSYPMYAKLKLEPAVYALQWCDSANNCRFLTAKEHAPTMRWHIQSEIFVARDQPLKLRKIIDKYTQKIRISNKNIFSFRAVRAIIEPDADSFHPYKIIDLEVLNEVQVQ